MPSLCRHIRQCLCCSFDDKHDEHNAIANGHIHKTSTISADEIEMAPVSSITIIDEQRPSTSRQGENNDAFDSTSACEVSVMDITAPEDDPLVAPPTLQFVRQNQVVTKKQRIFNECRSAALIGDKSTMRRRHAAYPWVTSLRDESGNTLLIYAAMCDRADLCMWLLRHNAQPAVADAQGRTALHWATVKHARRTMKTLLTERMRHSYNDHAVLIGDESRVTPMHLACKVKDVRCLTLLLSRLTPSDFLALNTSNSLLDAHERSPLHYACAKALHQHVKVLLNDTRLVPALIDVDERDEEGRTALMWAAMVDDDLGLACVKAIIGHTDTAWSTTSDAHGLTVCHLAVIQGNARVLAHLLSIDPLAVHSTCDHQMRTPLHWAALLGKAECAQMLCEKGAILSRDSTGATPLHYAASARCVEIARTLLAHNDGKDVTDTQGRTSFMWAVLAGASTVVEMMLGGEHTAVDRQWQDAEGSTALHLAAHQGIMHMCQTLVQHEWAMECRSLAGMTPLMRAVCAGQSVVVEWLVQAGADIHAQDAHGRTALHWCCLAKSAFICAVITRHVDYVADEVDGGCRTALHYAAFAGDIGCATQIVQSGANVNGVENSGLTPLHMAAARGHAEIVAMLVDYGAPVNALSDPLPPAVSRQDSDVEPANVVTRKSSTVSAFQMSHDRLTLPATLSMTSADDDGDSFAIQYGRTPLDMAAVVDSANCSHQLAAVGGLTNEQLVHRAATIIQAAYRGFRDRQAMRVVPRNRRRTRTMSTGTAREYANSGLYAHPYPSPNPSTSNGSQHRQQLLSSTGSAEVRTATANPQRRSLPGQRRAVAPLTQPQHHALYGHTVHASPKNQRPPLTGLIMHKRESSTPSELEGGQPTSSATRAYHQRARSYQQQVVSSGYSSMERPMRANLQQPNHVAALRARPLSDEPMNNARR